MLISRVAHNLCATQSSCYGTLPRDSSRLPNIPGAVHMLAPPKLVLYRISTPFRCSHDHDCLIFSKCFSVKRFASINRCTQFCMQGSSYLSSCGDLIVEVTHFLKHMAVRLCMPVPNRVSLWIVDLKHWHITLTDFLAPALFAMRSARMIVSLSCRCRSWRQAEPAGPRLRYCCLTTC